jgi:hypothetical protein
VVACRFRCVTRLSPELKSHGSADPNMELPANARVDSDGDAIADGGAHAASRGERALARCEGSDKERLARLKDAAADNQERCDGRWPAVGGRNHIPGQVARDHQVAVMLAGNEDDFRSDAGSRGQIPPGGAPDQPFADNSIVGESDPRRFELRRRSWTFLRSSVDGQRWRERDERGKSYGAECRQALILGLRPAFQDDDAARLNGTVKAAEWRATLAVGDVVR